MKLGWVVAVSVTAVGLSGCGSSHRRSLHPRPYSVQQVETVFAAHGMTLVPSHQRTTGAVVALLGRGGVKVLVDLVAPSRPFGWTGEKRISRGNLIVFRPAAYEAAVYGALHDLH